MRFAFGDLVWFYLTIILPSPRIISAFAPPSTSHPFQPAATTQRLMTTSSSSLGTTSTVPPLSGRIIKTLDPCVVLMKQMIGQYADAWKDKGGIYSLAQGVVYWKPPDSATAALVDAIHASQNNEHDPNLLHMYGPDEGLLSLRQALQQKLVVENGLEHHDVMITVGANQAYVNCVLTLLEQHHKAVVFAPYYFNHVMALQMTLPESGLLVGPTKDNGFPDLEWLEQQFLQEDGTNIQMVTLVNPGNPTGTTLPREFLQKAVDLCRQNKCWLILDSTYEYFVLPTDDDHDTDDSSPCFDGCFTDPHVVHIFSLSKAYALAGYRVGYLAAHRDATGLYESLMKVQDTIPICPSRISQIAALGALQAGREWVRKKVQTLQAGRRAILQALEPLEQIMGGSGAMYVMGKLPGGSSSVPPDDQEVARRLVEEYGVAVIPGSYCGFPGWIRVCYANLPPDDCRLAAERLLEGLKHLCKVDGSNN